MVRKNPPIHQSGHSNNRYLFELCLVVSLDGTFAYLLTGRSSKKSRSRNSQLHD